jgi:hypothetical protein
MTGYKGRSCARFRLAWRMNDVLPSLRRRKLEEAWRHAGTSHNLLLLRHCLHNLLHVLSVRSRLLVEQQEASQLLPTGQCKSTISNSSVGY